MSTAFRARWALITLALVPLFLGCSSSVVTDATYGPRTAMKVFVPLGHAYPPTTAAWSPNGRFIATGADDGYIVIWSAEAARELARCGRIGRPVVDLEFTAAGDGLLAALLDGSLDVWRVEDASHVATLEGHRGKVSAIAAGADPDVVVSGGTDGTVRVWSLAQKSMVRQLEGGGDPIAALDICPDGRWVAAASTTRGTATASIRIWSPAGDGVVRELSLDAGDLCALAFSPDGAHLMAAGARAMGIWRTDDWILRGRSGGRAEAACWLDAVRLVAYVDGGLNWFAASDLRPGNFVGERKIVRGGFRDFATKGDGTRFVACDARSESPRLFDVHEIFDMGRAAREFRTLAEAEAAGTYRPAMRAETLLGRRARDVSSIAWLPDSQRAVALMDRDVFVVWDFAEARADRILQVPGARFASISADGRRMVTAGPEEDGFGKKHTLVVRDLPDGRIVARLDVAAGTTNLERRSREVDVRAAVLSRDGARVACLGGVRAEELIVFEVPGGRELGRWSGGRHDRPLSFDESGRTLQTTNATIDIELGLRSPRDPLRDVRLIEFSREISLPDADGGTRLVALDVGEQVITTYRVSGDRTRALVGVDDAGDVILLDATSGARLHTFRGHSAVVHELAFSPDGRRALSSSADGTLRLWDLETGRGVACTATAEDWVIFDADGNFAASRRGGELVSARVGGTVFAIDQAALRFNRPDRLLRGIGLGDEAFMEHLEARHERRLRRAGIAQEQLDAMEATLPLAEIRTARVEDGTAKLELSFTSRGEELASYQVFVGDVPLYGRDGAQLRGRSAEIHERVPLCAGENNLEVSCRDSAGGESFRVPFNAQGGDAARGDLWFLGFGVSRYRDSRLDLAYAHKDAQDLERAFRAMEGTGRFAAVHTKLYLDEQVTVDAIRGAKSFLSRARIDDTFVLFVAGHGVYDTDGAATYYFVTHDADPDRLAATAADFDFVEDLLQGIAPRRKLFLLDTCESGELDDDLLTEAGPARVDLRGRATRDLGVRRRAGHRAFLDQRDRYLYNDLLRRSGAIVFSSSRGGEQSFESRKFQNGTFTHFVIECLEGKDGADVDGDGTISTDELRDHVSRAVAVETGDRQHPVVDRDNIQVRFGFPVVRAER